MKAKKHNLIWILLFGSAIAFGQKQPKKIQESFTVNPDVLVEIKTTHTDVTIETWDKNVVAINGVWEIKGDTKEEVEKNAELWNFEALGNKNKVIITSKPADNYYFHSDVFDGMDFDFDMESITFMGGFHNGDYFSELPPMPPMPEVPQPFIAQISEIEFDYEAYEKDKEGYMKEFQKRQEEWQKKFHENVEPQMKLFEEKMKKWEEEVEPKMKEYEVKMKEWEKKVEPQMKEQEKKMEEKMAKMEKEMEEKYAKKMEEKNDIISKNFNTKKSLVIQIPKGAILKLDTHKGKIVIPKGVKTMK